MKVSSNFEYLENIIRALEIKDMTFVIKLDNFLKNTFESHAGKKLKWEALMIHNNNNVNSQKKIYLINNRYVYDFDIEVFENMNSASVCCKLVWFDADKFERIQLDQDVSQINIEFEIQYNNSEEFEKWKLFEENSTPKDFIQYAVYPVDETVFIPKKYSWLSDFAYDYQVCNLNFIIALSSISKEIELLLGISIDWNNVILMNRYNTRKNIFIYEMDDGKKSYVLNSHIGVNPDYCIPINIMWTKLPEGNDVDIQNLNTGIDLKFKISIPDYDYSAVLKEFQLVEKPKEIKLKLKSSYKFRVKIDADSLPHEGKLAISIWNIADLDAISKIVESRRDEWNNQTDLARQASDTNLDRGYCHDISFEGVEGNVVYFYIDTGSEIDGIYEFLLI